MKLQSRMLTYFFCLLTLPTEALNAAPIILSGEISSPDSQVVTAPKTRSWQIQLQWMAEEGKIVKPGDVIAIFDSGGTEAQLEQNRENIALKKLQLEQTILEQNQAVKDAEDNLKVAEMVVKKFRIEASIPEGEISGYEKGKHELDYEKALLDRVKAKEKLQLALKEREVAIQKQRVEIIKVDEEIAYQEGQLEKLSVQSVIEGPVTYMMHPWSGKKIASGTNVQASWSVLKVQAQSSYQVSAWVHEADREELIQQGKRFKLVLDAFPSTPLYGRLISISNQSESKENWSGSAYYRIEISFDEQPELTIFPGMSVRVISLADEGEA